MNLLSNDLQSGGGWHHPVHIHLSDYLVLAGKGRDSDAYVDWDILTQVKGEVDHMDAPEARTLNLGPVMIYAFEPHRLCYRAEGRSGASTP